jgi:hypothetical protein
MKHLTSAYIIELENGKLTTLMYRPTDYNRRHVFGTEYSTDLSHDLTVNENNLITVERELSNCTFNTKYKGVIVAKKQYYWDYDKPMGSREEFINQSDNYLTLLKKYFDQNKSRN